jgi:hypothetical protein
MTPPSAAAGSAAVGDVVLCRDASYRENLKIPGEIGLVLEARADRAKVFFPTAGGEPWIPTGMLARVKDPAAAGPSVPRWMAPACFLARTLQAIRIEVAKIDAESCALRLFHGEVGVETLDRIRGELGEALRYFTLAPAGMHKIETAVAFALAGEGEAHATQRGR